MKQHKLDEKNTIPSQLFNPPSTISSENLHNRYIYTPVSSYTTFPVDLLFINALLSPTI